MISSDFRTEARRKLSGKWGKAAVITLIYAIIAGLLSWIQNQVPAGVAQTIVQIAIIVVEVPLSFGFAFALYKMFKGEEVNYFDFFSLGFTNFAKAWTIALHILLKMIVPVILIIVAVVMMVVGVFNTATVTYNYSTDYANIVVSNVSGTNPLFIIGSILLIVATIWAVIRGFLFVIANYIAFDNMDMASKEVVEKSQSLMNGKRGKYFVLMLTFIGWMIVCGLTFGIASFWVIPYIQFATFAFYKFVAGDKKEETAKVEETTEPTNE